jgi:hypothetical protein
VDLLWIGPNGGLADLENAAGRRDSGADYTRRRHEADRFAGWPTGLLREAPARGGHLGSSARGRPRVKVVDRAQGLSFDVADTGIFIMDTSAKPQATIDMFSFASRQVVPVARLPAGLRFIPAAYLTVTRDGRSMLYIQFDQWTSDIEMLRGFR